jgi:hypothetical protein
MVGWHVTCMKRMYAPAVHLACDLIDLLASAKRTRWEPVSFQLRQRAAGDGLAWPDVG